MTVLERRLGTKHFALEADTIRHCCLSGPPSMEPDIGEARAQVGGQIPQGAGPPAQPCLRLGS